jgi:oxygen-dependent protoporphyrinogen oxidase
MKELGIRALVVEASARAGGLISTVRRDGFLFEMGPQGPRFPASIWRIVRELGLEREFVAGDPKAKRYIVRDGKLERAPFSPGDLISTGLVGIGSKLRILGEPFGSTRPPESEESVASFVRRKFGDEVLDYLVQPIVSTVFLGDAERMGMASAFPALVEWERESGSLARGALSARGRKRSAAPDNAVVNGGGRKSGEALKVTDALPSLGSFRGGIATLTDAIARSLGDGLLYDVAVSRIACGATGEGWEIFTRDGAKITAEALVVAAPAHVAGELLRAAEPRVAEELSAIEYAPMSVVSMAYEHAQVGHSLDGFGFMVPHKEGLRTICTFWNSSLFPGRAPDGRVVITSFARRADEHVSDVVAENAKLLGITGEPVEIESWRDASAMPQYNVGHAARVRRIESIVKDKPGLYLAGNYLRGRSMGECADVAIRVAEDVAESVRARSRERIR